MNIAQIENNLQNLLASFSAEDFIYDLLLAYGSPKTTVTLLRKGNRNLAKEPNTVILKKKLFFRQVDEAGADLHALIDGLRKDPTTSRHDPRFIIVTDYKTLLAVDTKTQDSLDIDIMQLAKHFDFFLPWTGQEKYKAPPETEADVKAAERMAKLYDEILKDNPVQTREELHGLNVFLSRLLFCFFAEDTGIFPANSFTGAVASHTQEDGEGVAAYLNRLFEALNTKDRDSFPEFFRTFPYVNGGLFGDKYHAPAFSRRSRKMMIECGELDWSAINPDIFGSMIQAVVHPAQRSGMGMHYTSVPNIMKVIEPLFLNELREEFEKHYDNKGKLEQLLARLGKIRIFDPACGSGNFLIIAYKKLRELEMDIFRRTNELTNTPKFMLSQIKLSQFYGIELDDFAHEVAILSLWLAEHQMNVKFKAEFGSCNPTLPLKEAGNIVCGNATRIPWVDVCPKDTDAEIYILGNPPYLGSSMQDKKQKADMAHVFAGIHGYKNLDYIACWFLKAAQYISGANAKFAFVSTNSICQGEQVGLLWPHILEKRLEIGFAHTSFKWTNNAKGNAGVTCCIVGVQSLSNGEKLFFNGARSQSVKNINPHLAIGNNVVLQRRSKPISKIPEMVYGNKSTDNGHLFLNKQGLAELLSLSPTSVKFVKKLVGSIELIQGIERWCLWIPDSELAEASGVPFIRNRLELVVNYRLQSQAPCTVKCANTPNRFKQITYKGTPAIVVPRVSSERRVYIPFGFVDEGTVVLDSAQAIYNPAPYIFGIISSCMHMTWVRTTAGRLKTDYRYSSALCYNTFPIPELTEKQKETITQHVYNVLEEREKHPEKTMAELYDPEKMPDGLRNAHNHLDLAVEQCYRSKPFTSDEERLEYLFKLYEEMVASEGKR